MHHVQLFVRHVMQTPWCLGVMGFFLVFVPIIGMHLVHKYGWEHWEPIFIVMKIAVWVSAVNAESDYVRKEPLRKRGPYLENPYADVDEEEEEYGDRTDYR